MEKESIFRAAGLAAWNAPSPDNNQPFRMFSDGSLETRLDPSRSLPSDVFGMFDLMAIGAAVENGRLEAKKKGYKGQLEWLLGERLLSDGRKLVPAARIRLLEADLAGEGERGRGGEAGQNRDAQDSGLGDWIEKRCTNRGYYSRKALADKSLERLKGVCSWNAEFVGGEIGPGLLQRKGAVEGAALACGLSPQIRLHWLTRRQAIWDFAWLVGVSDRLRFEQRPFHQELFKQLRWTPAEAERTRDGLDLRTLALPPGGKLVLRLISHWPLLKAANCLGASALLAMPSIAAVIFSGAVGLLSVDMATAVHFLEGGRAFQRLWLAATAEGLQLQPLGSLPIFLAHLDQLQGEKLTPAQRVRAQKVKKQLLNLVPELEGRTLLMAFRIGYGRPPKYRSLRRPLEDVLIELPEGDESADIR